MKKLNFFFVFILLGCLSSYAQQNWSTSGNTLTIGNPLTPNTLTTPTVITEYIGSNAATSNNSNADIVFGRRGVFAGRISSTSLSLGLNSWYITTGISKQNTMIGNQAGMFTSNDVTSGVNGGNTYIGYSAGRGIGQNELGVGFNNVCVGNSSGENMRSNSLNVFVGADAGRFLSNSSNNVCIGFAAGSGTLNVSAGQNVIVGTQAGQGNEGQGNVFIGTAAGRAVSNAIPPVFVKTTGEFNTFLGHGAGLNITNGSNNTLIGRVTSTNPALSNTVIIGDGGQFQRLYIDSRGYAGIGLGNNVIPDNRLELNSTGAVANTLGLRFRNCPTTSIVNPTNNVLSVNAQGDVILVEDKQSSNPGGLSTTCNTANFITKSSGSTGNLTCSQIFDNGTSVGIGSVGPFNYNSATNNGQIGGSFNGVLTLDINGATKGIGFYATSDKKFKKDIQPIESALDKIMSLEGKTYNWRKDEFKDKNFTSELQYGLLAQDVQKVIPSLVIESENGDLAMNYTGLIPVLIEALKEQQAQINELKQQATDNFKAQNQDLLQFSNTKIISVSPNPSNDVISISMNIEKEVQTAILQVYDINGVVLSSLSLKERATNFTKTLQKDNFGKGIYIVSLVINGKSVDTKKIVFN